MSDDRQRLVAEISGAPGAYVQDGLISVHNHEFINDPDFIAAYQRGVSAAGKDYAWHWRVHIGLWAAKIAARLPGDFVECGVNAGFMSSSIMHALNWNQLSKVFYLLDTFSGIDPQHVSEIERSDGILEKNKKLIELGFYVTEIQSVIDNFSEWKGVEIIQGVIPDTLQKVAVDEIAFLHIDLNCAPPEVAALEYFWEKLVPGAPVLLDDYAYFGYQHQKHAIDKVAIKLGASIASLPTGQGLIIKS